MSEYQYDVIYIGAGHGTFDGAIPLSARGFKVAVVELDKIGGTCPNRGCNPKIALDEPVLQQRIAEKNTGQKQAPINWRLAVQHKHEVIDELPDLIQYVMSSNGIEILHGKGFLQDAHTVNIADQSYTTDKIVIATGLRPNKIDVTGSQLTHSSDDFMEITEMPNEIVILGGGYIALEFATMANAAGSKVTVIMRGDRALRKFPQKYVDVVIEDLKKRGVNFIFNAEIKAITDKTVRLSNQEISTNWVLDATGRIPNVENMGLENIGVQFNANGIVVNDKLQTNVENIYASGDVIDKVQPKLTPTAVFESKYLMHLFAGDTHESINYPAIPTTVFTSPRISQIGITLEEASQKPDKYTVNESILDNNWYRKVKEETGFNAVIKQGEKVVGAVEVSDRSEDVINAYVPVIELGLENQQLERLINVFPTITSDAFGYI
ncbi:MAG: NAD(P)/FAD-dependent oxidoreductase [Lactobacillaceae bacterium]|jgi:glutathione reductase (NADPH)|nr:NAD(P)/FAD-dependent oxidoreductase [Lactobacillaceae bacterium]